MKLSKHSIWLFVGILLLSVLAYGAYNYAVNSPRQPIDAVPDNAGMVFSTGKPMKIWQKLKNDNDLWTSLCKNPEFGHLHRAIITIDSALRKHINPDEFFENRNIIVSLHHLSSGKKEFLFVTEINPVVEDLILTRLLGNQAGRKFGVPESLKKYRKIRIAKPEPAGSPLYYTFRKGLFMASYSPELLGSAIEKLYAKDSHNPMNDMKAALSTVGHSDDATLLVNFNQLPDLVMGFSAPGFTPGFARLRHFARYAVFDIYIQKQKVQLSGYTLADALDFLRLFKEQEALQPSALNLLPEATSSFIYLSFSNFNNFVSSYNNYLTKISGGDPSRILSVSLMENLKEMGLTEIAVALVNAGYDHPLDNTLVVMRSTEPQRFSAMLNETLVTDEKNQLFAINQRVYRNIDFKRVFGPFLYNIFPEFEKACYIAFEDYFLFASSPSVLQDYVTTWLAGKTLPRKSSFKALLQMAESRSNIWIYYNPAESAVFHHYLFSDKTAGALDANLAALSDFDGLSLQFSGDGTLNYTSAIIKHRNAVEENIPADMSSPAEYDSSSHGGNETDKIVWEAVLEEEAASEPFVLTDFPGRSGSVGIFGTSGAFYLYDLNGQKLWRYSFPDKPFASVALTKSSGQKVLTICSREAIYCLNEKGKLIQGYPARFPHPAQTQPSLVFGQTGGNPMLVYASADSMLRAVDLRGKPVKGWKMPSLPSLRLLPIKSFTGQSGKALVVPFQDGHVLMFAPDGNRLMESGKAFTNSNFSEFYVNETNHKGQLLTTDPKGNLIYLNPSGPIEKTVFDNFSESHYFIYADFNNDRDPDFIYADDRKLVVYDRFKKVLLQFDFPAAVNGKPILLEIPSKNNILVVKAANNHVYCFESQGLVAEITLPRGEVSSAVGLIQLQRSKQTPVWISVVGNKLIVNKLKD